MPSSTPGRKGHRKVLQWTIRSSSVLPLCTRWPRSSRLRSSAVSSEAGISSARSTKSNSPRHRALGALNANDYATPSFRERAFEKARATRVSARCSATLFRRRRLLRPMRSYSDSLSLYPGPAAGGSQTRAGNDCPGRRARRLRLGIVALFSRLVRLRLALALAANRVKRSTS